MKYLYTNGNDYNLVKNPNSYGSSHNDPSKIIIHSMGEYIETDNGPVFAPDFLKSIGLSAHMFITPDGDVIETRSPKMGAYHAKGHNTGTIGIELLVKGTFNLQSFYSKIKSKWCTPAQFDTLIMLVEDLCFTFQIPPENILRHSDVDPQRKKDPGSGFPWDYFMEQICA